ncbi:MAG TPA: lipid II flippase MurJ, partial [Paralcaligenes sp.]
GLPAAMGMALLSDGLVATLFNYGAFTGHDVMQTRLAVMAYSVGLLGLLSIKILAPGFYAKQDIRTPVKIAIFVLILTQVFNVIFVPLFAHAGLALSIGLGASVNALFLLLMLYKHKIYQPRPGWGRFVLKVAPALAALALVLSMAGAYIDWVGLGTRPWLRVLWLGGVLLASAAAYFGVLLLCGFRPRDFTRRSA